MDLFADDLPDPVGGGTVPGSESPPPRARTPRTRDHVDLDDWDVPTPRRGSRRWLLAAAVVPWGVVVAVMLAGGSDAPSPGTADPAVAPSPTEAPSDPSHDGPAPAADTAPVEAAGSPGPTPPDEGGTIVTLGGGGGPSRRGEAEGLALVVARSWLSARPAGPELPGLEAAPGAADRYVEHLAVESVDHPARGAAVVTLRAVVLPVQGDAYGTPQQLRVAVPVVLDAEPPRLAGPPWLLEVPPIELAAPPRSPVDDADLQVAAAEAVTLAGYRDVELSSLERTDGWAAVAVITARAPGEEVVREHEVWLRSDVGRLVVAGTTAPPTGPPPPRAEPTTDPRGETPTPTPEASR